MGRMTILNKLTRKPQFIIEDSGDMFRVGPDGEHTVWECNVDIINDPPVKPEDDDDAH